MPTATKDAYYCKRCLLLHKVSTAEQGAYCPTKCLLPHKVPTAAQVAYCRPRYLLSHKVPTAAQDAYCRPRYLLLHKVPSAPQSAYCRTRCLLLHKVPTFALYRWIAKLEPVQALDSIYRVPKNDVTNATRQRSDSLVCIAADMQIALVAEPSTDDSGWTRSE
jgi:hypothetical protein